MDALRAEGLISAKDTKARVLDMTRLQELPPSMKEQLTASLLEELTEMVDALNLEEGTQDDVLQPIAGAGLPRKKAVESHLPVLKREFFPKRVSEQMVEMEDFYRAEFSATRKGSKALNDESWRGVATTVGQLMGFQHFIKGKQLKYLTLAAFLDQELVMEVLNTRCKDLSACTTMLFAKGCISVAKFLTAGKSKEDDWSDIPCIKAYRKVSNRMYKEYVNKKKAPEELVSLLSLLIGCRLMSGYQWLPSGRR